MELPNDYDSWRLDSPKHWDECNWCSPEKDCTCNEQEFEHDE